MKYIKTHLSICFQSKGKRNDNVGHMVLYYWPCGSIFPDSLVIAGIGEGAQFRRHPESRQLQLVFTWLFAPKKSILSSFSPEFILCNVISFSQRNYLTFSPRTFALYRFIILFAFLLLHHALFPFILASWAQLQINCTIQLFQIPPPLIP